MKSYKYNHKNSTIIPANAEDVFDFIDNPRQLSSHMNKSSWMMAGSHMNTKVDAGRGQEVGSHIIMKGKAMGIPIFLDEIITRREPPVLKIWETVGMPKLVVIDHYQMKIEIQPQGNKSLLNVSINYNLPTKNAWLGTLFGRYYAKWCVNQILKDSVRHFAA